MHRSETVDLTKCADCGVEVAAGLDRAFALGEELVLCLDCAEKRGGAYDENEDRWEPEPDVSGLAAAPS